MATYLLTEDGHRILLEDLTGALLIEAQADGAYWARPKGPTPKATSVQHDGTGI